jgi:hypothetical protein
MLCMVEGRMGGRKGGMEVWRAGQEKHKGTGTGKGEQEKERICDGHVCVSFLRPVAIRRRL